MKKDNDVLLFDLISITNDENDVGTFRTRAVNTSSRSNELICAAESAEMISFFLYFFAWNMGNDNLNVIMNSGWVAVISAKNHERQRRKRQSVTAKREKSQTPKVLTAILTLPYLT